MDIVDCLKITEDKSSENKVYIPDERLIIATCVNAKTQSMKLAPQHQYSTKTRGSKPASQLHCNLKTQSMKPASGRVRNPRLPRFRVGIQNARLEARVPTTENLYVSVITALITGSITAHVTRELTPIMKGF